MTEKSPIQTTVIGSYPLPSWLEFAGRHPEAFGPSDIAEIQDDAVTAAIQDQMRAGLDVITDGEQSRFDFNLSFYGYLSGIERETQNPRRWGPPAHDQRGNHRIIAELTAPSGLGCVEEFERLKRLAPEGVVLKASVPGPFTLSGRLETSKMYPDRWAITEALLPIVRTELEKLVEAGCRELTIDEPSMSCYAYREDTRRFVDIFNRTVESVTKKCRLSTHLCFGNYKGHSVGYRRIQPMFPDFLDFNVAEMHVEMANREFSEIELISQIAERMDVAVGVIDVKSYYIESAQDVAERIKLCLKYTPAEKLSIAPDCGLSQTARWAAKQKLANMVAGAKIVRAQL